MSEEEKEAIDYIIYHKYESSSKKEDIIDIVINYIDKLQKENEELKGVHNEFLELHQELKARDTLLCKENILNAIKENYISKDIIKKLIEDKKQIGTYNIEYLKIEDLEELLGE